MVTVYSKPNCQPCNATKRYLEKTGMEHQIIDISQDPDARDYVISLGFQETPVVVAPWKTFSGFRPDLLKAPVI